MNNSAVEASLSIMDAHITGLNARDAQAIAATLHFPHHRLSGTSWKTWETPEHYFKDFLNRAGGNWSHSSFEDITVLDSSETKVHLDAEIRRYDADNKLIISFRSLWVIVNIDGVWAAKVRSSFAPQ